MGKNDFNSVHNRDQELFDSKHKNNRDMQAYTLKTNEYFPHSIEVLELEAFSQDFMRQQENNRLCRHQIIHKHHPELWQELLKTIRPPELLADSKKEEYVYRSRIECNGIKVLTNKGKNICAITALVHYKNNKNPIPMRGDFTGEKIIPKMADALRDLILVKRKGLVKKATIFYNLWTKPRNIIFQVLNDGASVVDGIEDWKKELNF